MFSIITPVRNAVGTIERTLDSVAEQAVALEHLVLDAASTDGTLDLLEARRDSFAYFRSEADAGIAAAFNEGIRAARGDYVLFLNADDYLLPGALERVRHALDEGANADIVYGDIQVIDRDGHAFVERADHTLLHRYMSLHHPAMLFRRELLSALGGYDEAYRLAMDSELVHRAIAQGASLQRVDEVVAAMARGGLSDRYHLESLWEYRRSVVRHGLSGRMTSLAYFVRQILVHLALRVPGVRDWRLSKRAAVSPDRAAGR